MYLLGQTPEEPDAVQDRKVVGQGVIFAGLLGIIVWVWAKSRPTVTFRETNLRRKARRNPRLIHRKYQAPSYRRRPLTASERIAEAQTNLELMRLGRVGPRHIARATARLAEMRR